MIHPAGGDQERVLSRLRWQVRDATAFCAIVATHVHVCDRLPARPDAHCLPVELLRGLGYHIGMAEDDAPAQLNQ